MKTATFQIIIGPRQSTKRSRFRPRLRLRMAASWPASEHREVAAECRRPDQVDALRDETARFSDMVERKLAGADLYVVQRRAAELGALLARGLAAIHDGQAEWLGGHA